MVQYVLVSASFVDEYTMWVLVQWMSVGIQTMTVKSIRKLNTLITLFITASQ